MIVSPAVVVDLDYSLHHSAPNAVEYCGSYFAVRTLLSEHGQALSFVNLICRVISIVALLGILDTLTGTPIVHDLARHLTQVSFSLQHEYRADIFRAASVSETQTADQSNEPFAATIHQGTNA